MSRIDIQNKKKTLDPSEIFEDVGDGGLSVGFCHENLPIMQNESSVDVEDEIRSTRVEKVLQERSTNNKLEMKKQKPRKNIPIHKTMSIQQPNAKRQKIEIPPKVFVCPRCKKEYRQEKFLQKHTRDQCEKFKSRNQRRHK
jgi:hypothetical protein